MPIEPESLNIPYPPKNHWKLGVFAAVVLFTPLVALVSPDFAKAYFLALVATLPGLWLFIMGDSFSNWLRNFGDLGTIVFWLLVAIYMWFAKNILLPAVAEVIDRVLA